MVVDAGGSSSGRRKGFQWVIGPSGMAHRVCRRPTPCCNSTGRKTGLATMPVAPPRAPDRLRECRSTEGGRSCAGWRGDLSLVRDVSKRSWKKWPTFQISANIGQRSRIYTLTAMAFIVAADFQEEQTGLADHDAFTADVRLQTERYERVRRRLVKYRRESARSATRAARFPAPVCWQFGEYRFA